MSGAIAKKSLGQHWLDDEATLKSIVDAAKVEPNNTVLEIGPGLGSLTRYLVKKAKQVVAVELDSQLAVQLHDRVPAGNLQIREGNILEFDLSSLPAGYKVVANIPYYLTGNLLRSLTSSVNPPAKMVLLLQKEVAQRLAAGPGQMSLLAVSVQLHYRVELGQVVPASLFKPPPKVDSQITILELLSLPLLPDINTKLFFQIVRAGFSGRRKKLRSSLSAGLHLEKKQTDELLKKAGIDGNRRAQELSLQEWHKIYRAFN